MFGWTRVGAGLGGDFDFALDRLCDERVATAPGIPFGPGGRDHVTGLPTGRAGAGSAAAGGLLGAYERQLPVVSSALD